MKKLRKSKTFWCSLSLPLFGWIIQWRNGGELPLIVQSWGPLTVAVGFILLRLTSGDSVLPAYDRCPVKKLRD